MCRRREFQLLFWFRWFRFVSKWINWFNWIFQTGFQFVVFSRLGGPIHYESEGRLFLVGVLNGADGEAVRPSALSYSTLVKPFMEWIDGNIQHNRCITKEFGPLRTYSLIAIISATCFFIILYSTYLVKAKNRLEKEAKESKVNPVWD